ncbi:MAG: hypothetical protein QF464_19905 [Myxococcota bacterium]|nr:hypothetical protein [Myxococcota bacterium]
MWMLVLWAVGCAGDAESVGSDTGAPGQGDASQSCAESAEAGFEGDEADVFCELVAFIRAVDMDSSMREAVIDCLPDTTVTFRKDLLADLETGTEEHVLQVLQALAYSQCETTDIDEVM